MGSGVKPDPICILIMLVYKLCQELCLDQVPWTPASKLGDGADGEVFDIADDPTKVIKFCVLYETGGTSVQKMYKRIGSVIDYLKDSSSSTYAQVYEHRYLGLYSRYVVWGNMKQNYILYYYTMEKLYKISEDEKKVFHSLLSHEDRGIKKNYSADRVKKMINGMTQGIDFDAEKVMFFCDNFRKTSVIHHDIHIRNIMKDANGYFKLIDFDRATLEKKKMTKPVKVDLKLLKKLVGELEASLHTADAIGNAIDPDTVEQTVELSKAAGLCAGIMQEASLLVMDIHSVVRTNSAPVDKSSNLLDTLMNSIKGGDGSQN
jgi:serine/threonine protein kinase